MKKATIISIDLAKNIFQILGVSAEGKTLFKRRLNRIKLIEFISQHPACTIVMEACYSSHYWGRTFEEMGHAVKLIPAQHVTPFVRGNKNDKNDALAIYEASLRPQIRCVPIKSEAQQEILSIHKIRERLIKQKTACMNQIRGLLVNFGLFMPQGHSAFEIEMKSLIHEQQIRPCLKMLVQDAFQEFLGLKERLKNMEKMLQELSKTQKSHSILMSIPGVGPIIASAFSASIDQGQAFKNPKELAVWLGLTPRQYASGTHTVNKGITKRGNSYLRKQLIHGARAIMPRTEKKNDDFSLWVSELRLRKHACCAVVAVAHKIARLMWVLLKKQQTYQPQYQKGITC